MNGLDLLLIAIATWRLSYMLASETGPFDAFVKLRTRLPLGGLTSCMYCVSIWTAPVIWLVWQTPAQVVVLWLALSGAALMLGAYSSANYRGK